MPPGHVAALAGTRRAACRARGGRGLPPPRARRDRGRRRGAAEPVAGPARPDQRGAHGGRTLAGGAGRRAAHPRRGQRRRPAGGLGGRAPPATCTGWVPACAGSSMPSGCPSCEGRIEFTDGTAGRARAAASPVPTPEATLVVAAGRGGERRVGRRADRPRAAGVARPVQPGQRADGGRGRRGVRASTPARRLAAMEAVERGGRPVHRPRLRRRAGPAHAGQEPGRMGRAARPGGRVGRAGRGQHQRAGRRRCRPELAVGRALRAPGRAHGGGDRRPLPRPVGAPALRRSARTPPRPSRCGPSPRAGGADDASDGSQSDAGDGWSTSSATTRRSTISWARPDERDRCASRWSTPTSWAPTATAATG